MNKGTPQEVYEDWLTQNPSSNDTKGLLSTVVVLIGLFLYVAMIALVLFDLIFKK